MGGRCFLVSKNPDGSFSKTIGPECTDNFQIVENGFEFNGSRWHSVEQAFQALKFPSDSIARGEIFATSPKEHESDEDYGLKFGSWDNIEDHCARIGKKQGQGYAIVEHCQICFT